MNTPNASDGSNANARRSVARLAAVQALYQVAATGADYQRVTQDFLAGRLGGFAIEEDPDTEVETPIKLADLDQNTFAGLVSETCAQQETIDDMINANLSADWPKDRLELIVRSILRVAVAELLGATDAPSRVSISEYVDIAHAFYSGSEPKMVNAVLDKIARALHGPKLAAS